MVQYDTQDCGHKAKVVLLNIRSMFGAGQSNLESDGTVNKINHGQSRCNC